MVKNILHNKILFIFLLLFFLLPDFAYTQIYNFEYYKISDGILTPFLYDPYIYGQQMKDIITWTVNQANSIPYELINWNQTGVLPSTLDTSISRTQIHEAMSIWSSNSDNSFGFLEESQNQSFVVNILFTPNAGAFPDPYTDGGRTVMAVEWNFNLAHEVYVAQTYYPDNNGVTLTIMGFNNTTEFVNISNNEWTNNTLNLNYNQVCFKQVALHELGHMIGLGHNYTEGAVMDTTTYRGDDFYDLSSDDYEQLGILVAATVLQNPITQFFLNPYLNRNHYFFNYEPNVLYHISNEVIIKGTQTKLNQEEAQKINYSQFPNLKPTREK
jgi:Matrixin